jgi:acetyl esterase/lipase/short-subunit dehydrogenase involved in D-alanine esterification of teichoic acids
MALDPRVKLVMWIAANTGRSFRPDLSVADMRAGYVRMNKQFGLKDRGGVDVRELEIPAGDGTTIGARLYRPHAASEGPLPVLLFFHGGGFVIGDVDSYDGLTRFFAREGRIAVLSVDYRLGPENRFPRSFDDAFAALGWLQKNAESLGLSADHIAVGGDSAGGNISAALSLYAESRGLARPAFAFLIYPATDGTERFPSRKEYTGNLPLTPATIAWFAERATSTPEDKQDPLFVPLDAPHPERHPPAYILAAQYDPLVDEGLAYYERLRDAGVAVTYDLRPTLPHAFVNLAGILPEARRALTAGIRATAAALGVRPVVALTGAGSGIGRALAIELADLGYALALADRDAQGLAETAALVEDRTTVTTHVVDVAKKAEVDAFAAGVLREHHRVDVVINNAGVGLIGDVSELSVEEMAWLMDINFWGTVYGVKAFLPALQRAGDGTIVNISSVFGIFAPPGNSAYAASKFAVRGFTESLREELRGTGVHVITVHPGGIKTNIARTSRVAAAADEAYSRKRAQVFEDTMLKQTPEKAAKTIVRGILQRRDRVLIGREAIQLDVITRTLGPAAPRLLSALAQRSLPDELKRDNAKGPPGSVKPKEAAPPNPESSAAQNGATVEAGTSS